MATLQKIRSKGPLLVIVIGLALLAFIAEEGMRSFQSARGESRMRVGKIYSENISLQEYQALIEEYTEVIKFTSNNSALTETQMAQIRDQVWNTLVNNRLIEHEADKLGLTVTDEEVRFIISQGRSALLSQTPFKNENGRFDPMVLQKFLADYENMKNNISQIPADYVEYYTNLYNFWMFVEKTLKHEALAQKYQNMMNLCLLGNSEADSLGYKDRITETEVCLVVLPYSSVADSAINISQADINNKYKEMKPAFKQLNESRDIKFIDVKVTASVQDKAALDKEMDEAAARLLSETDYASIVRDYVSTVPYRQVPVTAEALPKDIAQTLDTLAVGEQTSPYLNVADNTMNVVRLIEKISAPDSIEYRQIEVTGNNDETIKLAADSIMLALSSGEPFDSTAAKYNQTGEKKWITSRAYQTANMDADNLKYIQTITTQPIGLIEKIDFAQGSIIVQVTDRRSWADKYNVAVIKRPIEFSKETYAKAYNDFSQFIASHSTQSEIEADALKNGYALQERKDVYSSEHNIGGVTGTREMLRWIFNKDTQPGNISPLYECGENDHMMVAIVTDIHKKGYRTVEALNDLLKNEVTKDKKAEQLIAKLSKAQNIEQAAKIQNASVDTIGHITFSANTYVTRTASSEPVICAAATKTDLGQYVGPLKGNAGVYALKVLNRNEIGSMDNFDAEDEKTNSDKSRIRLASRFANELYENAKITDNRYLFY